MSEEEFRDRYDNAISLIAEFMIYIATKNLGTNQIHKEFLHFTNEETYINKEIINDIEYELRPHSVIPL